MRRASSSLSIVGTILSVAGLVLLALEVARTLNDKVLGTLGTVLLWLGVGLLAVGLLLLVLTVAAQLSADDEPAAATDGDQPAGDGVWAGEGAAEPATAPLVTPQVTAPEPVSTVAPPPVTPPAAPTEPAEPVTAPDELDQPTAVESATVDPAAAEHTDATPAAPVEQARPTDYTSTEGTDQPR